MPRIVLYSAPPCGTCALVKSFFQGRKLAYHERDISADPLSRAQLVTALQHSDTPVIEIGGRVVVGFDLNRLSDLIQESSV